MNVTFQDTLTNPGLVICFELTLRFKQSGGFAGYAGLALERLVTIVMFGVV